MPLLSGIGHWSPVFETVHNVLSSDGYCDFELNIDGDITIASVSPSRYLLLNHWTESNQMWCVCCSHDWGVQRHILTPPPGALGRDQKGKYD